MLDFMSLKVMNFLLSRIDEKLKVDAQVGKSANHAARLIIARTRWVTIVKPTSLKNAQIAKLDMLIVTVIFFFCCQESTKS